MEHTTIDRIAYHASDVATLLDSFGSDREQGLDDARVKELRERFGRNQLTEARPTPIWRKIVAQFKDLVIWILIFAAILSGALGEWVDTVAILAIVLLNGVIGFLQEERAGKALAAPQKMSSPMAKVLRTGLVMPVPASDLELVLRIGAWCNSASIVPCGDGSQAWQVIGDPTEGALVVAARKAGIEVSERAKYVIYELPFDSTRKALYATGV